MSLEDAKPDLNWIARLPGRKVMIRGNHDYWWHAIGKVRSQLHPSIAAIQNDALVCDDVVICGTRGWVLPDHPKFTGEDLAIYDREAERLKLSLAAGAQYGLPIIAMIHYPPTSSPDSETKFTQLLEEYQVRQCVYGHLHGPAHRYRIEGRCRGVTYQLVSADFLDFSPLLLEYPGHHVGS